MADSTTASAPSGSKDMPPIGPMGSNFTSSNCGTITGTATGPALEPGAGWLGINGSVDLAGCIVGNSGAFVSAIRVVLNTDSADTVYRYRIEAIGQGPAGIGSGSLDLVFTDGTGDSYGLSLTSSTNETHSTKYNSSVPGIVSVQWSPS